MIGRLVGVVATCVVSSLVTRAIDKYLDINEKSFEQAKREEEIRKKEQTEKFIKDILGKLTGNRTNG